MDITLPAGMSLSITSPDITGVNRRDFRYGDVNRRDFASDDANRRAITACPSEQGYRLGKVGSTYQEACLCAKSCGPSATCKISEGGQWVAMLVPDSACEEVY